MEISALFITVIMYSHYILFIINTFVIQVEGDKSGMVEYVPVYNSI